MEDMKQDQPEIARIIMSTGKKGNPSIKRESKNGGERTDIYYSQYAGGAGVLGCS